MKCKVCGTEFDEGIFCPECGAKYQESEESVTAIKESDEEKNISNNKLPRTTQEERGSDDKQDKKKNKKATHSLILGILSWLSIITISLSFFSIIFGVWSIVDGIKALKGKTKRRKSAIWGIIFSVLAIGFMSAAIVWGVTEATKEETVANEIIEETNSGADNSAEEMNAQDDIMEDSGEANTLDDRNGELDNELSAYLDKKDSWLDYYNGDNVTGLFGAKNGEAGLNAEISWDNEPYGHYNFIFYIGNDKGYYYGYPYIFSGEMKYIEENVYGINSDGTTMIIKYDDTAFTVSVIETTIDEIWGLEGTYELISESGYPVMGYDYEAETELPYEVIIYIGYLKEKLAYNDDAIVYVDDEEIGMVEAGNDGVYSIGLPAGEHQIWVESDTLIRNNNSNKLSFIVDDSHTTFAFELKEGIWGLKLTELISQ